MSRLFRLYFDFEIILQNEINQNKDQELFPLDFVVLVLPHVPEDKSENVINEPFHQSQDRHFLRPGPLPSLFQFLQDLSRDFLPSITVGAIVLCSSTSFASL